MPKLRFPGFEGEWKTVVLSDFTERVTRKNVNNESNLPLTISSKDGLVDQISYFNKPVASRDMSGYYLLHNGEFAYNKSYSVGYDFGSIKRLDIYPKGALSTLYICFALKKYDSDFIKIYFDSLKWYREICMIAAEGARNHGLLNVSADAFFATKHILPQNEKEQKKIATFMVLLEKRVVLQQQLVDALKSYKRGALSQLFPKNGASVPEYRFSGFTGDWEQRKLGEVADIVGGGTPSTGISKYWNGDIDWYAPAEIADQIYVNSSQKKITELGYKNSSAKILPPGTVLFTSRAGIGKTAILARESCTNQGFQSIVPHENELDSYFIFSRTGELKHYAETVGAGSTFVEVSGKQMANMDMMMPKTFEEQKKIGIFFSKLDNFITLHQKKVEQFINLKQSMLEKLFI